jgi:3-hydroxybutyryl-CoA dehydratase
MPRYFEEIEPGEVFLSPGRTVTEADVVGFAALTGDWNELHVNEEFARQGYYGRRIAHGALIFSISIGLGAQIDRSQQPDLIAFYSVDRLRFVKPVFLGDTIRLRRTIRALQPLDETRGILQVLGEIINQDDAITLTYTAKMLVRRRPTP